LLSKKLVREIQRVSPSKKFASNKRQKYVPNCLGEITENIEVSSDVFSNFNSDMREEIGNMPLQPQLYPHAVISRHQSPKRQPSPRLKQKRDSVVSDLRNYSNNLHNKKNATSRNPNADMIHMNLRMRQNAKSALDPLPETIEPLLLPSLDAARETQGPECMIKLLEEFQS